MKGRFVAVLLMACGGTQPSPAPVSLQPCALGSFTLQVPVDHGFALAAGEDACLLVDEREEATLVSFATLASDAEGAPRLESDPRRFWQESGLLGEDLRFTGRGELEWLGEATRVDRFVATPEGLPPRAGFALASRRGSSYLLVLGLHAPGAGTNLEGLLSQVGTAGD